jgi:hypothetical protein
MTNYYSTAVFGITKALMKKIEKAGVKCKGMVHFHEISL